VELVYFLFQTGYISREFHDPVHELNFEFQVILDKLFPGWTVDDLPKMVKEARNEQT
jgi:hypothetical protein